MPSCGGDKPSNLLHNRLGALEACYRHQGSRAQEQKNCEKHAKGMKTHKQKREQRGKNEEMGEGQKQIKKPKIMLKRKMQAFEQKLHVAIGMRVWNAHRQHRS